MVDMARLIHSPDAGVFSALADETRFMQVAVEYGAVTWPAGGPDLAPDAMHEVIAKTGQWTL
jgi:hypothetical protein